MPLAPGTMLGPYEILAPLGAGGMGEVFRARDTRLGRDVAVKVLPDHLRDNPKALARFESEARAVAALSHPHILAIHDFGRIDGTSFAVTELLEGETLRTLLLRGPVPLRRALEIARPLADALAAAHAKGIVHRDLKPENVFLTRDGHVKLLDFGLARHSVAALSPDDTHSPTAPVLTDAGAVLGTVAYMSPEQARGLPADHRSDQFSLGVLLYEMLSGRRPFRGDSAVETLTAIIREEPEPLGARVGGLPPEVAALVRRLLAKDPQDRFDSSRDLAREVSECWVRSVSAPAGISAPTSGLRVSVRPSRGIRRAATVAALAAIAALAVLLVRRHPAAPAGAPAPPPASSHVPGGIEPRRVIVAVFENHSLDPSLDPLGRIVSERVSDTLVRTGLDVMPSAWAVEAAGIFAGHGSRPTATADPALALGRSTGSGLVVSGSFASRGTDLELTAKVTDTVAGRMVHTIEPVRGPLTDPMAVVEAAALRVRDALAVRLLGDEAFRAADHEMRPPRYEAYVEYLLALEAREIPLGGARLEEHLRKAIALDPDFVQPYLELAAREGDTPEGRRLMEAAEARSAQLSLVGRAGLAFASAQMKGNREAMVLAARDWVALAPGDVEAKTLLAQALMATERLREAVAVFSQPGRWELVLSPGKPEQGSANMAILTTCLHMLGEHEKELAEARRAMRLFPEHAIPWMREAAALAALGRLDELDALLRRGETVSFRRAHFGGVLFAAAYELRAHGFRKESIATGAKLVDWTSTRLAADKPKQVPGFRLMGLLLAERFEEARAQVRELRATQPDLHRGTYGALSARLGDVAEARRIERELARADGAGARGNLSLERARIAAALGEKAKAISILRTAIAEGWATTQIFPVSYFFHCDTWLEDLRGEPEYEELVRPRE